MGRTLDAAEHDEIFLQMQMNKSLQRDADGNVVFTVEASNENLDFEGQRVLQSALLGTKDYFLKSGVVSKDHKHRTFRETGGFDLHEEYVIGEPLEVFAKGTSTIVKGKLYANNEYAQQFIKLLEAGSSRIKASVGGLVPKVKKAFENGRKVGQVVSVLWDDLALTIAPVNPTVEPAEPFAKSLSSLEFVKALSAGYGTDSADFTGGRALQKEDGEYEKTLFAVNGEAVAALAGAIADGDVTGLDDILSFLAGYGISNADARDIARAVAEKSNLFMEVLPMAKSLWAKIKDDLRKSVSGKKPEDDDEPDEDGDGSGDGDDDGDDDFEDATPVVKALNEKIGALQETIETMAKAQAVMLEQFEKSERFQKSLGEGMIALMERTEEVLDSPAPRKGAVTQLEAAIAKALGGGGTGGSSDGGGTGVSLRPFTAASIDMAKDILTKAVSDGKLDILTCGRYETQMNKSVGKASYPFTPDFVAFMRKELGA
ncbi:MAG: hypothetical protein LBK61_12255 [Spirochaetaceae bacterium]|jgi:hypothetical protein|nr:hypothetical protein [Spirochaetaceae bacterium]